MAIQRRLAPLGIALAALLLTWALTDLSASTAQANPSPAGFPHAPQLAPAQDERLQIDHQVDTGSEPIVQGSRITYTVGLRNTSNRAALNLTVETYLSAVEYLSPGVYVEEVSFRSRVEHDRDDQGNPRQLITVQLRLNPEQEATLVVPVLLRSGCPVGQESETLVNQVRVHLPDDSVLPSRLEWVRPCPSHVAEDVTVSMTPICTALESQPTGIQAGQRGNQIGSKVVMTNTATEAFVVGYGWAARYIGETEKNLRTGQLLLEAGESRSLEVWTDMRPDLGGSRSGDLFRQSDEEAVDFAFYHTLLPRVQQRVEIDRDSPNVVRNELRVRARQWDLGDAPDSSNHFGVTMSAYPGVQASFPTVHDLTVNPTQIGPAHANPRHFHLGWSVSLEPDADLGPRPNIRPRLDEADLDEYDDGAVPHTWNLVHCETTTIDVRIFISPQAADWFRTNRAQGYLNAWVDGNRNGSWGQIQSCGGGVVAFEHFVIDHAIDAAALGPGYHTLSVPTMPILWPQNMADRPVWARLTLSEQPAEKPNSIGQIRHGDGRGPATPFRLGETEDYLLRPAGSAGSGPDMAVSMTGSWRPLPEVPAPRAGDFTFQKIEMTLRSDFANLGTQPAHNVRLTFDFPEGVTQEQIERNAQFSLVAPRRDAQTIYYTVAGSQVTVELGTVAPGERGHLLVTFIPDLGDEVLVEYQSEVNITSDQDLNPDRNRASFKVEIEGVTQGAFEFRSPDMDFGVQEGTTNSPEIILQGFYQDRIANEDGLIPVWVHRVMVGMGQKDTRGVDRLPPPGEPIQIRPRADGSWSHTLTGLADGFYQFAVGDPAACDARNLQNNMQQESRQLLHGYGTVCGLAVVDSGLPVNPISLRFVEVPADAAQAVVRTYRPNTVNWSDGEWHLHRCQLKLI